MKAIKISNFTGVGIDTDEKFDSNQFNHYLTYVKNLDSDVDRLFKILHGNASFGSTVNLKRGNNIFGQWATVSDTGNANTEFIVPHTLSFQSVGITPGNYFITYNNTAGVVYDSGTAWTKTNIYLKCSVAHAKINLFITR